MAAVHKWGVIEDKFKSKSNYNDPLRDITLICTFRSPSGKKINVEAFWDGSSLWRVRFMPDEIGSWTYKTACSNENDKGLHNQTGRFECVPYEGENPLYIHGPLRLSENRRYLIHSDGTPFFWLADTAWNGILRSTLDEWRDYLRFRRDQVFTAVQFVLMQYRGCPCDEKEERAFEGKERVLRLNVEFFKRVDPKFPILNEHGFVAVPVLLWAIKDEISPGSNLADDDALLLVRYLTARYGAYILVWTLAGDGDYRGEKSERWKRIGRAAFHNKNRQLVTMHPAGKNWVLHEFLHEDWYDIVGYQSGHGVDEYDLKWLCFGPPSKDWRLEPARPVINLEPNYEEHLAYRILKPITAHMVRRAAYWSLLVSPTAGVTYGTNGVWYWTNIPEVPINHPHVGVARPWRESVKFQGAEDMARLKKIFSEIPWWTLIPDPDMLIEQPGLKNVELFVASSRSVDKRLGLVYTPEEQELQLNLRCLRKPLEAAWVNPRTGEKIKLGNILTDRVNLKPPESGDWLLLLKSTG